MPWVECEHTLDKTRSRFVVRKPITSIGRDAGNDLVLKDPMIERSHASLLKQGGKLTLTQASLGIQPRAYQCGKRP